MRFLKPMRAPHSGCAPRAARADSPGTGGGRGYWLLALALLLAGLFPAPAGALVFRGCFASGPNLDGTAAAELDTRVDNLAGALVGTGSWQAANAKKLKNAGRTAIEDCVSAAKADSKPGDEFVFYFIGHGGDAIVADAGGEAGEGNGHDNHIRLANTGGGAADRMTDDQLAALLSGFMRSVTMSVILNSCYSHTFLDGANDLPGITQVLNGANVPIGDHLAVIAASTAANPTCTAAFTDKLVEGLGMQNGKTRADANKDGTTTTEEAHKYAGQGTFGTGGALCDEGEFCPTSSPGDQQPGGYDGLIDCGPGDPVCTRVATTPAPGTMALVVAAIAGIGATGWRRRGRRERRPS